MASEPNLNKTAMDPCVLTRVHTHTFTAHTHSGVCSHAKQAHRKRKHAHIAHVHAHRGRDREQHRERIDRMSHIEHVITQNIHTRTTAVTRGGVASRGIAHVTLVGSASDAAVHPSLRCLNVSSQQVTNGDQNSSCHRGTSCHQFGYFLNMCKTAGT